MNDRLLVATTILAFAVLLTAHLTIVVGLVLGARPWRAPLALVLAPLAPYWALRSNMRARAGLWLLAASLYAGALWADGQQVEPDEQGPGAFSASAEKR